MGESSNWSGFRRSAALAGCVLFGVAAVGAFILGWSMMTYTLVLLAQFQLLGAGVHLLLAVACWGSSIFALAVLALLVDVSRADRRPWPPELPEGVRRVGR